MKQVSAQENGVVAGKCAVIVCSEISTLIIPKSANMDAKIKLIKKDDRNAPAPAVEPEAGADPKEWSTAVKTWVKEFQRDRRDESLQALDSLFTEST